MGHAARRRCHLGATALRRHRYCAAAAAAAAAADGGEGDSDDSGRADAAAPPAAAPLAPQQLTRVIVNAGSWWQLQEALRRHGGGELNHIHASAALTRCAHLLPEVGATAAAADGGGSGGSGDGGDGAAPAELLLELVQLAARHAARFEARQTANSLWALAKLRASVVDANEAASYAGRELIAAADALVGDLAGRAAADWDAFPPQELALALHALAALSGSGAAGAGAGAKPLLLLLPAAGLEAAVRRAAAARGRLKPQELAMVLGAALDLDAPVSEADWRRLLERALGAAAARELEPRHAAALLRAAAAGAARGAARRPRRGWLEAFAGATEELVARCNGQDLAMALFAFGRLQQRPPRAWLAEALRGVLRQRRRMAPGELCMCLHGIAGMRVRPPERWVAAVAAEVAGGWQRQDEAAAAAAAAPGAVGAWQQRRRREQLMLLWALGRLRYRLPPEQLRPIVAKAAMAASSAAAMSRTGGGDDSGALAAPWAASTLLASLARLGYLPPRPVLSALLASTRRRLGDASPQGVACALWAAARLLAPLIGSGSSAPQAQAQRFAREAIAAARQRLGELTPQGLAMVAWAAVQLAGPSSSSSSSSSSGGSGNGDSSGAAGDDGNGSAPTELAAEAAACVQAACAAALDKGLDAAPAQSVALLLWAVARAPAGAAAPMGGSRFAAAAVQRLADAAASAPPQALALGLWATARIVHRQRRQLEQQQEAGGGAHIDDGAGLAGAITHLLEASAPRLGAWRPQDLAHAAWALSRLRAAPPDAWLRRAYVVSGRQLGAFAPGELANLAWALLRMPAPPPAASSPSGGGRAPARPPAWWLRALRAEAEARAREDAAGGRPWRGRDRRSVAQAVAVWARGDEATLEAFASSSHPPLE